MRGKRQMPPIDRALFTLLHQGTFNAEVRFGEVRREEQKAGKQASTIHPTPLSSNVQQQGAEGGGGRIEKLLRGGGGAFTGKCI